jgi:hypothetical protein
MASRPWITTWLRASRYLPRGAQSSKVSARRLATSSVVGSCASWALTGPRLLSHRLWELVCLSGLEMLPASLVLR